MTLQGRAQVYIDSIDYFFWSHVTLRNKLSITIE